MLRRRDIVASRLRADAAFYERAATVRGRALARLLRPGDDRIIYTKRFAEQRPHFTTIERGVVTQ